MPADFKSSKKAHEFIGLCLGVLADKRLVTEEVEFLRSWLRQNPEVAGGYPVKGLFIRICEMLEDRVIDGEEEKELLEQLHELTSSKKKKKKAASKKTFAPSFASPVPPITFKKKTFYLHGQFIIGTKEWLHDIISQNGGLLTEELNDCADFCIIGAMSDINTLAEKHPELKKLKKTNIVAEEDWISALKLWDY